jgi:protein O-GlcNAc transferase
MHYLPVSSPADSTAAARQYGCAVQSKATAYTSWNVQQTPCLRVGIVSGDLRDHPVGNFLEGVLANLDPKRVELFAYPTTPAVTDLTHRIARRFSAWKPIHALGDEAAARLIHGDGVHILLDVAGHTAHNRLPLFAWKPAPLQVSWLGYFGTTGLAAMDYVLGDPIVAPEQEDAYFCESLWRLPECYLCFTAPNVDVDVGPLPMLTRGHVTFGCFNNVAKLNDSLIRLWSAIVLSVPDSQMFLKAFQFGEPAIQERIRASFAANGIDAQRLRIEGPSSRIGHYECYNEVDIALDPFPYPGGTTSAEALWMGVPVLTKRGDRFLGHLGETIAVSAGLGEWVAGSDAEYSAKAIAFAEDVGRLKALRAKLRNQVLCSPLFDAQRFARNFENALVAMWNQRESRTVVHDR